MHTKVLKKVAFLATAGALLAGCSALEDFRARVSDEAAPQAVALPPPEARPREAPISPNHFILATPGASVIGEPQIVFTKEENTFSDLARAYGLGYDELVEANPDVDPWLPGEGTRVIHDDRYIEKRILVEANDYLHILAAMYKQMSKSVANNKNFIPPQQTEQINQARYKLISVLENRLDQILERIFSLLGLKYPPRDISSVYQNLRSNKPDLRINAVEFLDNLLEPNLKKYIIPIVETSMVDTVINRTLEQLGLRVPGEFESLVMLLNGEDSELQIVTLDLIARLRDPRYVTNLGNMMNKPDPRVKEMVKYALRNLGMMG